MAVLALTALSTSSQADSFREVRDRVYRNPLTQLPENDGLSGADFFKALLGMKNALMERAGWTLSRGEDFKPRAPKLLHPMGVCAEATWTIDGSSPATGLLSQGTQVRAMVRFSTADGNTVFHPAFGQRRVSGFAIKLFPTQDENQSVYTRNLFFLDQGGLDGDTRTRWLGPGRDLNDGPIFFRNTAPGSGLGGKILTRLFRQLDLDPTRRPVEPLTSVDANDQAVASPLAPRELRLIPHGKGYFDFDFRSEILSYGPGEIHFDIVIPAQNGFAEARIGSLVIGAPVVSTVCDQELHFHHHPN
jgi:hypothetical protein